MTRVRSSSAPELEPLIEQAKSVRPVSQTIRARVLRRAQSSVFSGGALGVSHPLPPSMGAGQVASLSGVALGICVLGAAVALYGRAAPIPRVERAVVADARPAQAHSDLESPPSISPNSPEVAPRAASTAETARVPQPNRAAESYGAELELLRRAQAAYSTSDYDAALRLLAEHGRRFPSGRLAEEREALRVRALSSSGQRESARLAASAFAVHFPRSVLLARTLATVER